MRFKKKMIWIPIAIALLIFGWICLTIDDWSRDWTNNYAELQLEIPQTTSDAVAIRITKWVESQSNWRPENQSQGGGIVEMHLTRQTALMRFTDDIHITLRNLDDACEVKLTSQSRVGKGDLGQNPRNLRELESAIRE